MKLVAQPYRKLLLRCLIATLSICIVLFFPTTSIPRVQAAGPRGAKHWAELPHGGLNEPAFSMLGDGSDLYVAGEFTETLDGEVKNLNNIALLSHGVWQPMPHGGLNGGVAAWLKYQDAIYVGGSFTATADGVVRGLNNIAKLQNGAWQALPNQGLKGEGVGALTEFQGDLYVGGAFTQTADGKVVDLNNIARLHGDQWQALPNGGLKRDVSPFAAVGNDLYMGVSFGSTADGKVKHFNNIARLHMKSTAPTDQGKWEALSNGGLNDVVFGLAAQGNDLYVAGQFTQTHDQLLDLNVVARYSGGSWHALPNHFTDGMTTVAAFGKNIYFAGQRGAFLWREEKWHDLSIYPGLSISAEDIYSFAKVGKDLYMSGDFYGGNTRKITHYFAVLTTD